MKSSLLALVLLAGCASDAGDLFPEPRTCEEQAADGVSTCDELEDADAATVLPEGDVQVDAEGDFAHVTIIVDDGAPPSGDLGTSQQALTIPNGFGTTGNALRCWSGVNCAHTGTKTYQRNFKAATCDAWQQSRWVGGEIRAMAATSQDGSSGGATWSLSAGTKNTFRCGTNAQAIAIHSSLDGAIGVAVMTISNATKKYTKGDIWIFPENFHKLSGWSGRSIGEVEKFYENAILHEVLHSMGLGHTDSMGGSTLMQPSVSSQFYASFLTVSGTERNWFIDYQP